MSLVTAKALREQRANLAKQAQDVLDKAHAESRNLTAEENQTFDKYHEEMESIRGQYERIEKQETINAEMAESRGRIAGGREQPGAGAEEQRSAERRDGRALPNSERSRADILRGWLMRGSTTKPTDEQRDAAGRMGVDINNKILDIKLPSRALRKLDDESVREWERRAQSVGTDSEGGYTAPDETMRALEVALLRFGGMRDVADVIRTESGQELPWPTLNDTGNTGAILAENTQVSEQAMTFSQLVLDAYKYTSKLVLVSVELLQDSSINIPEIVGTALGERIGRITNTHFTTGTGSSQPNGVATASTQGKVGTTGQTTSVIYEDLVDLQHSVDPEYRQRARWMFADSTLKVIKKLKDGDDRPLWAAGIAVREPDTILGHPFTVNQAVAAMAANAKSILFGDFSKYKIRDVRNVTLLRLDERYADFHQVAFLAFSRHDGDLLDAGTHPVKHYANSAT
jgi:HK97 family phage major capsid protein